MPPALYLQFHSPPQCCLVTFFLSACWQTSLEVHYHNKLPLSCHLVSLDHKIKWEFSYDLAHSLWWTHCNCRTIYSSYCPTISRTHAHFIIVDVVIFFTRQRQVKWGKFKLVSFTVVLPLATVSTLKLACRIVFFNIYVYNLFMFFLIISIIIVFYLP